MQFITKSGWYLTIFFVLYVYIDIAQGEHVEGHTSDSDDKSDVESFLDNLFGSSDTSTSQTSTATTPWPLQSSPFIEDDLSSSSSETSSNSLSDESISSEELENLNCYQESFLTKFCKVPDDMKDLLFWDVYSEIFSNSILEALKDECSKGTWCLHERFDYWESEIIKQADMVMNSEIADNMCKPEMTSCFTTIANFYNVCSDYNQIMFTKEAIDLVCHLRENKDTLGLNCFKQTLVALHVTVADIIRDNQGLEQEDEDSREQCESAEVEMTKGLMCMENSCPGEQDAFRKFPPWQWFTIVVGDLIAECGLDPTKCINVLQVGDHSDFVTSTSSLTSWESSSFSSQLFSSLWTPSSSSASSTSSAMLPSFTSALNNEEAVAKPISDQMIAKEINLMVGISIGVTVLTVLMVIVACTFYRRHRRNAVIKEGYQKLLSEGDES